MATLPPEQQHQERPGYYHLRNPEGPIGQPVRNPLESQNKVAETPASDLVRLLGGAGAPAPHVINIASGLQTSQGPTTSSIATAKGQARWSKV